MGAQCVLVAGPGGAGCSTYAAALARGYADTGRSVLVLGTDPYGDATSMVETSDGSRLRTVPEGFESGRAEDAVGQLLRAVGLDPRLSQEVGGLPEAATARLLWMLAAAGGRQRHAAGGDREAAVDLRGDLDTIVVDAGSRATDLVRLAGAVPWILRRLAPAQRGWLASSRPLLAAALGSRWPGGALTDQVASGLLQTAAARQVLLGAGSVAVVCAGSAPHAKVRRAVVGLALNGAPVTAILGGGPASPADIPRWHPDRTIAEQLADLDRNARTGRVGATSWAREGNDYLWRMPLPGLSFRELSLSMVQDDLVLEGLGHRAVVAMPTVLRRCRPVDAQVRDAVVTVRFSPVGEDERRDDQG